MEVVEGRKRCCGYVRLPPKEAVDKARSSNRCSHVLEYSVRIAIPTRYFR